MYETSVCLINNTEIEVEIPVASAEELKLVKKHATAGLQGERPPCITDFNHLLVILVELTSLDKEEAASIALPELNSFFDELIPAIQGEDPFAADEETEHTPLDGLPVDEYGQVDLDDMR